VEEELEWTQTEYFLQNNGSGRIKMTGKGRFFPFRYKLGILLFTVVFFVAGTLGIFQYLIMRYSLEDNFEQNKKLVHDRVLNMMRSADYVNMLYEKPIEEDAREILNQVRDNYEADQEINFDLHQFLGGRENVNLYIIDSVNTVIATTNESDLGLSFAEYPDFVQYLDEVRAGGEFSTSRITQSIVEGNITKFCYLPSSDGKYIFEAGSVVENKSRYDSNIDFNNFEYQLLEENDFIDNIQLYDYHGLSYKKDENGDNIRIDASKEKYFRQALDALETVKVMGEYDDRKAYYEYIPYEIMGAQGANERNVIEVIYNDRDMQLKLKNNLGIMILVVLGSAVFSASLGYFMSIWLTKPVDLLTEGVKQVAAGNLKYEFKINRNDELSILGGQFNTMTGEICRLLEERYQFESDLQLKNQEIFSQKEEISALYEETSALYEETAALNEELEGMLQQNQNSYFETVRALANAIDEKDSYTGGHCERVMEYSRIIALELGFNQSELNDLKFGSILHDIGKIGVSENILNKDGRLTSKEYEEIKKHPEKGNNILKNLNFLCNCRRIINEHHERLDGKGYPNGLCGEDIYFPAKIVCVADAYDAMTSSRPYRKNALSQEEAIRELLENKNTQFDARVVDAFVNYLTNKQPDDNLEAGNAI
jgi:HD-GYP domain-containing protein (c-di-GMP phosphodiesterase class II)